MVKVFYKSKINAYLGGKLFIQGVAEFEDEEYGVKFAEMFYLKYEIEEDKKSKKRVKKNDE